MPRDTLTSSERKWLRDWHDRFGAVDASDLGKRGNARNDSLGKAVAAFQKTPEYDTQPSLAADLMAYHRDRLMPLPVYRSDDGSMVGAFRAAAEERAMRLDHAMQEPEPDGAL